MNVGIPKEIKNHEYRVGLIPDQVRDLAQSGHQVFVQKSAGEAIGYFDEDYTMAGAKVVPDAEDVYGEAELIVKVKEPQLSECRMLASHQTLFTYLHLAPDPLQTEALMSSKASCIAYETVTSPAGRLPLLAPMSEVAGRMSIQAAAVHLEKSKGGRAMLMGGVPGVAAANVVILGAGVVGTCALQMAVGLGAKVTVDRKSTRLNSSH